MKNDAKRGRTGGLNRNQSLGTVNQWKSREAAHDTIYFFQLIMHVGVVVAMYLSLTNKRF